MSEPDKIIRVGMHKVNDPIPRHDFSAFKDSELNKTMGLVAASQVQLNEQIKSRMKLEPTAQEIRYFYYEVVSE